MIHFAAELEELHNALLQMGALVEASIHSSIQALVDRDENLARRVIADEDLTNRAELDIDARVIRLLALHQPVARDLRLITAALKINTDLERIGDLAVSISTRAISLLRTPEVAPPAGIPKMARLAEEMLRRSLDSFVKEDADLAQSVLFSDDELDTERNLVYDEIKGKMKLDPNMVSPGVDLMFVARGLERIGDHATNIAEDVIFLVRGVDVRHHALDKK